MLFRSAILHYLRLCVHSVITDEVRTHQFLQHEEPLQLTEHEPAAEDLADDVASTLSAQSLWQAIQEELNGKEERVLVYLTCIARMRPGEIRRQQPELFPTIEDVYRIKRNISERLRRNKRLQHLVR